MALGESQFRRRNDHAHSQRRRVEHRQRSDRPARQHSRRAGHLRRDGRVQRRRRNDLLAGHLWRGLPRHHQSRYAPCLPAKRQNPASGPYQRPGAPHPQEANRLGRRSARCRGLPLSFAAKYQAQILGNAYPLIYQAGSDAVNSTFENLSLQVARSYQGGYYQDGTWSEGTNVTFRNVSVACSTPNGCFPMRPGGQFFYLYDTVFFSNGAASAQWGVPEPFIQTISFGIGNGGTGSPQSLVSDIEFR